MRLNLISYNFTINMINNTTLKIKLGVNILFS